MQNYNPKNWHFLNMNSPADLYAKYEEGTVRLSEYDGCRDGHALVSDFLIEETMYFATEIIKIGQGVAIGLYYGDGCFSDYLLITAEKGRISVRVPNGVPQGDTFRRKGALRYYTVASIEYHTDKLMELAFTMKNQRLNVYADEALIIEECKVVLPFDTQNLPKLIVKALNETEMDRKAETILGGYIVKGVAKEYPLSICCIEENGKTPWQNGSIHIAGEYEKWTKTNDQGEACFAGLPFGTYRVVFGREAEEFTISQMTHDGSKKTIIVKPNQENLRENRPQENLMTDAAYIGLNGLWNFDIDTNNEGEINQWFLQGKHIFERCIRVPFSWQSLLAFGEEELVNEYTLHQANTFLSTAKEVGEVGWYQRKIQAAWEGETELVFAAVSGIGKVWLNGKQIGCLTDSYNQKVFRLGTLEIGKEYQVTVKVEYEHGNSCRCSGKQGFWFTDAPGIWQNVWLRERLPERIHEILVDYSIHEKKEVWIEAEAEIDLFGRKVETKRKGNTLILPNCKQGMYRVDILYCTPIDSKLIAVLGGSEKEYVVELDAVSGDDIFDKATFYIPLTEDTREIEFISERKDCSLSDITLEEIEADKKVSFQWENDTCVTTDMVWNEGKKKIIAKFCLLLSNWQAWSAKNPVLYSLKASILSERTQTVQRQVGIREIGISPYSKTLGTYITVNGEKTYIRGVLDQGYNPWGIYTYPLLYGKQAGSAEYDIMAAAECGYNLMRMHIKDNEPDWYRICDEKGMLVWDEIPGNFYGTAQDRHWQSMYRRQLKAAVNKHNYHPSVILCSTINESWGISGDHEKSPWNDSSAQELIRKYACFYKENHSHTLVIDNSGYGKTSETQILDYHSYPHDFEDAHTFFAKLGSMNYPGSTFNCYHENNKKLMQDENVLDLLQRTCTQDLQNMNYVGNECQSGQPVLLSEFVHTDRQEELIRIFPQFAGYVRMNLASAENEDTSPYTSRRTKRDFAILDYKTVNAEDFLYMDLPFLSKVVEEERIVIPLYVSLWSGAWREGEELEVRFLWNLIAEDGKEYSINLEESICGKVVNFTPYLLGEQSVIIPKGYLSGELFAQAYSKKDSEEAKIGITSVQFEIFPKEEAKEKDDMVYSIQEKRTEWMASDYSEISGFSYAGTHENRERDLLWGYGAGQIVYSIPSSEFGKGKLILEASTCDILEGTKITDENAKDGEIEIIINGRIAGKEKIKEQSTDMRALFSNSSASNDNVIEYAKTGLYGYGTRIEIPITLEGEKQVMTVEIAVSQRGVILYGKRMGRYGSNPFIQWET